MYLLTPHKDVQTVSIHLQLHVTVGNSVVIRIDNASCHIVRLSTELQRHGFSFVEVLLRKKCSKTWIPKDLMIAYYTAFLWNNMYMYLYVILYYSIYDTDTHYELPLKASSINSPKSWLKPAGQWLAIGPYPGGMVICRYDGAGTAVAIRNWSGMERRKPRSKVINAQRGPSLCQWPFKKA